MKQLWDVHSKITQQGWCDDTFIRWKVNLLSMQGYNIKMTFNLVSSPSTLSFRRYFSFFANYFIFNIQGMQQLPSKYSFSKWLGELWKPEKKILLTSTRTVFQFMAVKTKTISPCICFPPTKKTTEQKTKTSYSNKQLLFLLAFSISCLWEPVIWLCIL